MCDIVQVCFKKSLVAVRGNGNSIVYQQVKVIEFFRKLFGRRLNRGRAANIHCKYYESVAILFFQVIKLCTRFSYSGCYIVTCFKVPEHHIKAKSYCLSCACYHNIL